MDETYKQKFLEDATDLLSDLEKNLLLFEKELGQYVYVEEIFRILHTIKGAAKMFGFNVIGECSHQLENLYDLVRNNFLVADASIIDLTLHAVDLLKQLIQNGGHSTPVLDTNLTELDRAIAGIIESTASSGLGTKGFDNTENQVLNTYHVTIKPIKEEYSSPNSPLVYLIEELCELGESEVNVQKDDPQGGGISGERYLFWDIYLCTKEPEDALKGVFIFVEDHCEITINCIGEGNQIGKQPPGQGSPAEGETVKVASGQKGSADLHKNTYTNQTVKVPKEKVNSLMNWIGELVTAQASLKLMSDQQGDSRFDRVSESIEVITENLRGIIFTIGLSPFEVLFSQFERTIRDLSKELGKEVLFEVAGAENELDKTIIERLHDPFMHILRNCIDHGIEPPATRKELGKPEKGRVFISSAYVGTDIQISITDDGQGIDPEKLRAKAIERGLLHDGQQLDKSGLYDLIFLPGFSTAGKVSDISGRGVGMDVVRKAVNGLGGTIWVDSVYGEGTSFHIKVPITLSIIDGILVRVGDGQYLVPQNLIVKQFEVPKSMSKSMGMGSQLVLDDKLVPCIDIREAFGVQGDPPEIQQAITLKHNNSEYGILVDLIIGEYHAVLKPLGKLYENIPFYSGATVLGDGNVALVLDIHQVIENFFLKTTY